MFSVIVTCIFEHSNISGIIWRSISLCLSSMVCKYWPSIAWNYDLKNNPPFAEYSLCFSGSVPDIVLLLMCSPLSICNYSQNCFVTSSKWFQCSGNHVFNCIDSRIHYLQKQPVKKKSSHSLQLIYCSPSVFGKLAQWHSQLKQQRKNDLQWRILMSLSASFKSALSTETQNNI